MLLWLFEKIIGFPWCFHHWKVLEQQNLVKSAGGVPFGSKFILQCDKCGDVKQRNLITYVL
jgi:hypothetical protein